MKKPIVLLLMFFVVLGQFPAFLRAIKQKQTARSWFIGFVIALLTGCWLIRFLQD